MNNSNIDLSGAKILIVDDTPANLKVLRQALEPEGYSILIATSGEAAIKIAKNAQPDLILLDVQMPGIDGFETCRRLKEDESTENIAIIFVTARAETESLVQGFRAGSVDYIVKPFQNEEVLARVHTHLKIEHLSREIQSAADRKGRFVANITHEIRTPMTAIVGHLDNMLDGIAGELTERQQRSFSRIKKNSDYLLDLVNDLLDLHKIEAGRIDVSPAPFSIQNLIENCCATLQTLVKPDVELRIDIGCDIDEASTDEALLRQIILNLLSNALKFTQTGHVTIAVINKDTAPIMVNERPELEISVSDTGIGIPPEALETIFEELQQVQGANREHKGTGLGLAITKKLSHILGGSIHVKSELDRGSTFTLRIPAAYQH